MKIMVLDDDPILTMILADHLAERGHAVIPAYDGQLGALFCEQKRLDLVVIDYVLPKLNGLEVLERLRRRNRDVRAVIITGFPELLQEESERLAELDVDAVIEKPFSFSQIDEVVDKHAARISGLSL